MRTEIQFPSYEGQYELHGSLFLPDNATEPVPGIVLSGGLADSAERMVPMAEAFATEGFGVVLYEHRNTGISGGEPRQEIDPVAQYRDMLMAITFALHNDALDHQQINLVGTSFSGAHVLQVAAYDRRIKSVVSMIPWISGYDVVMHAGGAGALAGFGQLIAHQWENVLDGKPSDMATLGMRADDESGQFALFRSDVAMDYFENGPAGLPASWRNELTMRSLSHLLNYDVTATAKRISPTPLLMIVAPDDDTMPVHAALSYFADALEPKTLHLVSGGHYGLYQPDQTMPAAVDAAVSWLKRLT